MGISKAMTRTFVTLVSVDVMKHFGDSCNPVDQLTQGTEIKIVAFNGDWARIVSPCPGWIIAREEGVKKICKPEAYEAKMEEEKCKEIAAPAPVPAPTPIVKAPAPAPAPVPTVIAPAPAIVVAATIPPAVVPVPNTETESPFRIGDVVNVRNVDTEKWQTGTIVQMKPQIGVITQANPNMVVFRQVAPPATRTFFLCENIQLFQNCQRNLLGDSLKINTEIRVVEFCGEWAHIISPCNAWFRAKRDGVKLISPTAVPESEGPTELVVNGIPYGTTAAALAQQCQRLGAVPTGVTIYRNQFGVYYAMLKFSTLRIANVLRSKGLKCHGKVLKAEFSI